MLNTAGKEVMFLDWLTMLFNAPRNVVCPFGCQGTLWLMFIGEKTDLVQDQCWQSIKEDSFSVLHFRILIVHAAVKYF